MVTVSLCMIVKNEELVLNRILGQMKEIADEIIVVDTGSSDSTREIAKQYTDQVYEYEWNQDFSAARNFACSKASMDYWMWLDADDFISPDQQQRLMELKETLNPEIDIVMMKYLAGFDENGKVTCSYYRERLVKNGCGFLWNGQVHEAVTPSGNILYSPIKIQHRKEGQGDLDRNLNIYEAILSGGEKLEPRHQFYYGRELYYHQRYQEAIEVFKEFLKEPKGWGENKIDACLHISYCLKILGKRKEAFAALAASFLFDLPRAEICCEMGSIKMEEQAYEQAAYWYLQALGSPYEEAKGGFVLKDCYDYIPFIQLCVCYDRMGDWKKALEYHQLSKEIKPESEAVKLNQLYFERMQKQQ